MRLHRELLQTSSLAALLGLFALCAPATAQVVTGELGSPGATTTITGKQIPPPQPSFGGLIDELAIYDRAVSAAEIQAIYNAGSGGRCALTAVSDPLVSARTIEFAPPWPNPAARTIDLEFQLPARAAVRVEVVDVAGRRVSPLLENGVLDAGAHRSQWDGRDASGQRVAPGVYLVRISTVTAAAVQRVVLIK